MAKSNWFTAQTQSLYIARPDAHLKDLIYKHPDRSIPRGAKLTVRASECALFFREGKCVGRIEPGTVALDTANIPFLGHLVVDRLTDANHFLCELFFVSTNEIILRVPDFDRLTTDGREPGYDLLKPRPEALLRGGASDLGSGNPKYVLLGQYRDSNSALVVSVGGSVSYTLKVQNPERLIVGLAGQSSYAGHEVEQVLAGRLLNRLRQLVGRRVRVSPVLDVVSNVDAEEISNELREACRVEFDDLGVGVGRMFDLALFLDEQSAADLRKFGTMQSELMLAKDESFVQANVIRGQREAMQGLAAGLASGKGPMIMSGNVGAALQPPPGMVGSRVPARPPVRPGGGLLSGSASFLVVTDAGESGPYSARQLALMVLSQGQSLDQVQVRRTDDPPDLTFTANLDPAVVAEFQRRAGGAPRSSAPEPVAGPARGASADAASSTLPALDAALLASAVDGALSEDAVAILARMAVGLGIVPNEAAGRAVVVASAGRQGIQMAE